MKNPAIKNATNNGIETSCLSSVRENFTLWFPGSAWEPKELQALPAEASLIPRTREAEPPRQCVPRQEPGNERVRGGVEREVSDFIELSTDSGSVKIVWLHVRTPLDIAADTWLLLGVDRFSDQQIVKGVA